MKSPRERDLATAAPQETRSDPLTPPSKRARTEAEEHDILQPMNLLGARIEVLWTMEDPATEEATEHWWGASVVRKTGAHHLLQDEEVSAAGIRVPVVELLYDAKPEAGSPEAETQQGCFITDHLLYDVGFDGLLAWRKEGEEWEAPRDPQSPSEDEPAQAPLASLPDSFVGSPGAMVDTVLSSVLARYESKISSLQRDRQCTLADLIRVGKEKLTEAIAKKCEEKKEVGDGVLSETDLRDALASVDLERIKAEALDVSVASSCR
uniref:Uncharacterized protein n=1 Tax=Pinguiococcus pyrenoidosus TaxID=172671 RepID=A0A6U0UVG1_9STRA|mmetsp:Transcript_2022/g.8923  ORF Transcript_2022/g.8923 Transcript_2022/m.8923 type:complete len:265 (+) Transcript_2022:65-859(+)